MIKFTILGEPCSKANSRELVTLPRFSKKHQKVMPMAASIKSPEARSFERAALRQIPPEHRQALEGPMRITIHAYYASERPDLDCSLVLDCLQNRYKTVKGALVKIGDGKYTHEESERVLTQKGVVRNDRRFREQHFYHHIDRQNPRAEIEIEPLTGPLFDAV
jgi:Holliday junction resolvase RusA-like endonuclease